MVKAAAERVTEYLRDLVDDDLRAVVIVAEDDYELHHLAPDLRAKYSKDTFGKVVETFQLKQPLFSPDIREYPIGERRAVVHYHEHAFVLQFPYSAERTILISVTREVGRDLLGFIEECRKLVHRER